jgi:hypothetical protein
VNIDPDEDPEFKAAVRTLYVHLFIAGVILLAMWCLVFSYLGFLP